jgi:hypothetical protein
VLRKAVSDSDDKIGTLEELISGYGSLDEKRTQEISVLRNKIFRLKTELVTQKTHKETTEKHYDEMLTKNEALEQELAELKKKRSEDLDFSGISRSGESRKSNSSTSSEHEVLKSKYNTLK